MIHALDDSSSRTPHQPGRGADALASAPVCADYKRPAALVKGGRRGGRGWMRIIAGTWRSRRLEQPATQRTRPMPDRVKAAVFSILGSHYGTLGSLPPLRVADAFAGSGALGLEALSRGAAACWFFERDADALKTLRQNCRALGAGDRAHVVVRDAWTAAGGGPDQDPFDLIFLDPPYRDTLDASLSGPVARFVARQAQRQDNRPLIVLHHPSKVRFTPLAEEMGRVVDERRFGSHAITFFKP